MIYQPTQEKTCKTDNFGGRTWDHKNSNFKHFYVLTLIWRLIKIFFHYGNQEVYYHICGSVGKDAYDCPMDAENVEVRLTNTGPKVTIW